MGPSVTLSEDFISQYRNKNPFPNVMAEFTYFRTYSQWLYDLGRRESWSETLKRVAEYSGWLYQGPASKDDILKEIEDMYQANFNLLWLPAGRTLWSGGTKHSYENGGLSQFNCSFIAIDEINSFYDLMYALCLGVGVGFSVEKMHTSKLPKLNKNKISCLPYKFNGYDSPNYRDSKECHIERDGDVVTVFVPDTKEGWADGPRQLLTILSESSGLDIRFNLNSIRPEGDRIKGFGGKASGPKPYEYLIRLMNHLVDSKQEYTFKLKPIDVLDICNGIAKIIVAGGVRRSAQICLFDSDDEDIISAKMDFWNNEFTSHRNMSNNSIHFWQMPELDELMSLVDSIKNSYEPGIYNAMAASSRRVLYFGCNPCAEALLANKGVCNLVTVIILNHMIGNKLNMKALEKSFRQATRHCMRITNTNIELPEWDFVQKRDRLLGVSMTGCEDAFDVSDTGKKSRKGFDKRIVATTDGDMSVDKFKEVCASWVDDENIKYAFEMRIPLSLLKRMIKPEGTSSTMTGVSPGAHKGFGPFYRRRIRINRFDALAQTALEMGLKIYPEVGQGYLKSWDSLEPEVQQMYLNQANTWVVEFPVKTSTKQNAFEESAISQLNRYFSYQNSYVDHSTSITISVKNNEWKKLFRRIHEKWMLFIGISFQNKSNDKYDLAPYELMTESEYNEEIKRIRDVNMYEILTRIEAGEFKADDDFGTDCSTGACPVR